LSVLQAQELKLIYDVSALTLLTAAYLVAQAAGLGFIAFLLAISLANVTGYVIYAVVLMKLIDRRIGRSTLN